jgi:hypothetical protein
VNVPPGDPIAEKGRESEGLPFLLVAEADPLGSTRPASLPERSARVRRLEGRTEGDDGDLAARLDALRAEGAAAYDLPGLRFIEALLARATDLDGDAASRLRARAAQRLEHLRTRLDADRRTAEALVGTLKAAGADPQAEYEKSFESGDFRRILRECELALSRARSDDAPTDRSRLTRLCGQARREGLALPKEVEAALTSEAPDAAQVAADQLAQALFRHIARDTRSTVAVARAADRLPAEVGPYNPAALAGQLLAAAEALSPTWLRSLLGSLEDLGSLQALPPLPTRSHGRRRR